MSQMIQGVLQGSVLCRALSAVGRWCSGQWRGSRIVTAFLAPMGGEARSRGSVFYRLWLLLHGWLCSLFSLVRLDRALEGSIFRREWFWCAWPRWLAPIPAHHGGAGPGAAGGGQLCAESGVRAARDS